MTEDRFDSAKTPPIARSTICLSPSAIAFFEDENHLVVRSIRPIDGEERFNAIGIVGEKLFTGVFTWRGGLPRFISVEGAMLVKNEHIILPADPRDAEDFDATAEALDRGQRARLIRETRTALGLSQAEFANRFRVPVGTLRDWEQARATAPDFAVAYVRVIAQYPEMVAKAVA